MVTWQQIGQGEPNPFDVTYTTNSPYSASYGEFVITEGSQVDLPSPTPNGAVAVRSFKQTVTITTPSGAIRDIGSKVHLESPEYVLLVSDGTNWYVQSNESGIGRAIPDSVVDGFEEQQYEDQNATLSDYYAGDTSHYTRQTNTVQDGTYAVKSDPSSDGVYRLTSVSGLNTYPSQGDSFEYYVYKSGFSGSQIHINFACQDSSTYFKDGSSYLISDEDNINSLSINRIDGGTVTSDLDSAGDTMPSGEWTRVEVDWQGDGTINIDFYDSNNNNFASLSTTDTTYTSGGIAWVHRERDGGSTTAYFDNWRLL